MPGGFLLLLNLLDSTRNVRAASACAAAAAPPAPARAEVAGEIDNDDHDAGPSS
jgi:hypothetical protein